MSVLERVRAERLNRPSERRKLLDAQAQYIAAHFPGCTVKIILDLADGTHAEAEAGAIKGPPAGTRTVTVAATKGHGSRPTVR